MNGKCCIRCKEERPETEFYRNRRCKDGLYYYCIPCVREMRSTPEAKEKIRRRAVAYRKSPAWRQVQLNHEAKYPHKVKARKAVANALRFGKLVRQPCEECGKEAQAHHDDYYKPLDVRWLCRTHHVEWHRHNTPKGDEEQAA